MSAALEQSEGSTLTDLSSEDSSPEIHRQFSSASLYGHAGSLDKVHTPSPTSKLPSSNTPCIPEEPLSVKREKLRRDAERISLTRRSVAKRIRHNSELKRQELEKLLTGAHRDLDKLIEYTFLVVEENNSLKDILKGAVIVTDDGNLGDYSEVLLHKDRELPILTSLNQRSQLSFNSDQHLPTSLQSYHSHNQATATSSFRPTTYSVSSAEQIFQMSTDFEAEPPVTRARSLSEGSLKEKESIASVQVDRLSLYSSSIPHATIAENLTQAVGSQTSLDRSDVVRKGRASLSIKKLQALTLSESQREADQKQNDTVKHDADSGIKKNRKSRFSRKKKSKEDKTPVKADDSVDDDFEESDALHQKPKFFTSDMLSVIMERNELKEKLHDLEEKVKQLEKQIAVKSEPAQGEETGFEQRRTSFFGKNTKMKNRVSTQESEKFITDVLVIGYKKRERAYVYVIHTTWSDGQRFEIYRRYGEFFTYHDRLMHLFPTEAGKGKSLERALPTLPTIDNVLSLFGRTNNESVVKQRLGTINEYCQILLCELDTTISRSEFVISFFRPQPGDRQLQNVTRERTNSDLDASMILSLYPQQIPAGSTFEEYVAVADYEPTSEGEVSVKVGEVVRVISREATGWWSVCRAKENGREEEIGYVPGDFLKRFDPAQSGDENSIEVRKKYLGFVSSAAMTDSVTAEVDSALKYVATEDYQSDDPRQLCFSEGTVLIVVEKSEDGWWLVATDGRQGWAPASYLEPMDRRAYPEGENLVVSMRTPEVISGEKYITKAAFKGEFEEDISFPEKATIEVIEKSISGWWMVRYKGRIGMAPASMLALTEAQLNVPNEYKFAMTVDLGHGVSGIIQPPPRSKKFLLQSQTQHRQRSNTNTEEREFEAVLDEGEQLEYTSSSDSEDNRIDRKRPSLMKRHVRKRVITNENKRKKRQVKFKAFVRPNKIKRNKSKMTAEADRRGTLPASFLKSNWRPKKLHLEGMSAFKGKSPSVQSGDISPMSVRRATLPTRLRARSNDEQLMLSLLKNDTAASPAPDSEDGTLESDLSIELPLGSEGEKGEIVAISREEPTAVTREPSREEPTAVTREPSREDSWVVLPAIIVQEDITVNEQKEISERKEALETEQHTICDAETEVVPTEESPVVEEVTPSKESPVVEEVTPSKGSPVVEEVVPDQESLVVEEEPLSEQASKNGDHLCNSSQTIEMAVDL